MTVINQAELNKLTSLEQVLMWAIISINKANLDPTNTYISDNAGIRAESKDFISWELLRDDKGFGKFMFTALLPLVNPKPLEDKQSIIQRIWSYSPFQPSMDFPSNIVSYGFGKPSIPSYIDTTERLLAYIGIMASKICRYVRLTKGTAAFWANINTSYWADCDYIINDSPYGGQFGLSGYLTIDWNKYEQGQSLLKCLIPPTGKGSNLSCNFPLLSSMWAVNNTPITVDVLAPPEQITNLIPQAGELINPATGVLISAESSSAGNAIDSYSQKFFSDDALPDWYLDALNSRNNLEVFNSGIGSTGGNNDKPVKIIESLPVCNEQDPKVTSFGNQSLEKALAK